MIISPAASTFIVVASSAVVSALVAAFGSSLESISFIFLFVVLNAYIKGFNPLHPAVWLLPFVFLYHFSIFILEQSGLRNSTTDPETFILVWLCLAFCAIVLSFVPVIDHTTRRTPAPFAKAIIVCAWASLLVCSLVIDYLFLVGGYGGKNEAVGAFVTRLYSLISWLVMTSSILLYIVRSKIGFFATVATTATALLLISFVTGERNYLFSFAIAALLISFIKGHIGTKSIIIFGVIALASIPILGGAKLIFQKGQMDIPSTSEIVVGVFNGEFRSAGSNLDVLVRNQEEYENSLGATVVINTIRSVIPSFVVAISGPATWFNETFYPERISQGYGMGFTLFGEGYLNFGFGGALLMATLLGLVAGFGYLRSARSSFWTLAYIGLIPLLIYGLRADIANILSPFLKSVLLPMVMYFLAAGVFRRRTDKAGRLGGRRRSETMG